MATTREYRIYWHDNTESPEWTSSFRGYGTYSWAADVRAVNVKNAERLARSNVWRTKRGEEGITRIITNPPSRYFEITNEEDYATKLPELVTPSEARSC